MSMTSYSSVATLHRVAKVELAIELSITNVRCEYPRCTSIAFSVAESGVCMLLCELHKEVWSSSKQARRLIEKARLAELDEEIMRTVSAAYEDPGTVIHWDGSTSLSEQVFKGAEEVIESYTRRKSMPEESPAPRFIPTQEKGISTLSTLGTKNSYEQFTPFFL